MKMKKRRKEIISWYKFIESILLKKAAIYGLIVLFSVLSMYYLAANDYFGFMQDQPSEQNSELVSKDLSKLTDQVIYVFVTRKFGYMDCYFVNEKDEYELCYCNQGKYSERYKHIHKLTPEVARVIANNEYDRSFLPGLDHKVWSRDGYPLIYYHFHDGLYECFTVPGYHPEYGDELKPVTKAVAREWADLIRAKKYDKFVLPKEWAVFYNEDPTNLSYYDALLQE
ncbi:MAG: hypothetical protein AAGA77_14105 [Bacteroidota bacterium]